MARFKFLEAELRRKVMIVGLVLALIAGRNAGFDFANKLSFVHSLTP